jgi:hypothetical protein
MSTQQNELNEEAIRAAYQAVNQHWSHAEQERWSILNNFLTASMVLLLAWAAISTSQTPWKTSVLAALSLGGVAITLLWSILLCRANAFIREYGQLGEKLEAQLHLGDLGSFRRGEGIRTGERHGGKGGGTMDQLGSLIRAREFVLCVPALFGIIYVVLSVLSFL